MYLDHFLFQIGQNSVKIFLFQKLVYRQELRSLNYHLEDVIIQCTIGLMETCWNVEGLVDLLAGHVPHEVVHKLLHLFHVLSCVSLELKAAGVVGHLHLEAARVVVVLLRESALHRVLKVKTFSRLLKLLPAGQKHHFNYLALRNLL